MSTFERVTVGLFLWWSAAAVGAQGPAGSAASRYGVAETAERIESRARERGLRVLAQVDYGIEAERAGLRLPPTRALLLAPHGGADGSTSKLVVWQAPDGGTRVTPIDAHAAAGGIGSQLPEIVRSALGGD